MLLPFTTYSKIWSYPVIYIYIYIYYIYKTPSFSFISLTRSKKIVSENLAFVEKPYRPRFNGQQAHKSIFVILWPKLLCGYYFFLSRKNCKKYILYTYYYYGQRSTSNIKGQGQNEMHLK